MSYDFLQHCHSKPLTVRDLKPGDKFIFFPDNGDDSGHGGFKGDHRVFVKIDPFSEKGSLISYVAYRFSNDDPRIYISMPLDAFVIKLHGV